MKQIFVTGATGNQGGAVLRHLLQNGFAVKALSRNPSSKKAAGLKIPGVELIKGDLSNPSGWESHLSGVDGVFSVQSMDAGPEKEILQGINLAKSAVKANVPYFVYSSVIGADAGTGIPHWESKNEIENFIRSTNLNYTILRPASLYENLLIPAVRSGIKKGKYSTPLRGSTVQQYVGAEDIGRITALIFKEAGKYNKQVLSLAFEQMNGEQLASVIGKVLGKKMKYQQLPGIITRLFLGKNLYTMFSWVDRNKPLFVKDIDHLKKQFPGFLPIADWIGMKIA
jgi:uncharacterized protein YbjT (DUF2867 family)